MPSRTTQTLSGTHQVLKNTSFEITVASWLMNDGWQVFQPLLDHGHQTDILISDGPNFYRIQVKTVEASGEDHKVPCQWRNNIDCVVYFARNSNWGYVAPAFESRCRGLNHPEHVRFNQDKRSFLKAFHKLPVKS